MFKTTYKAGFRRRCKHQGFRHLGLGHWGFCHLILPFGVTQGGESFDFPQDREPVERPVEPFRVSDFDIRVLIPCWNQLQRPFLQFLLI